MGTGVDKYFAYPRYVSEGLKKRQFPLLVEFVYNCIWHLKMLWNDHRFHDIKTTLCSVHSRWNIQKNGCTLRREQKGPTVCHFIKRSAYCLHTGELYNPFIRLCDRKFHKRTHSEIWKIHQNVWTKGCTPINNDHIGVFLRWHYFCLSKRLFKHKMFKHE